MAARGGPWLEFAAFLDTFSDSLPTLASMFRAALASLQISSLDDFKVLNCFRMSSFFTTTLFFISSSFKFSISFKDFLGCG